MQDWTKQATGGDDLRISCLMLIVLDSLVSMATDSKLRLRICLMQAQLVSSMQKKVVFGFTDFSFEF